MKNNNKVIIITGPCGAGKTTITQILARQLDAVLIDGDNLKQTLFPEIDYITQYPQKLKVLKAEIFDLAQNHYSENQTVLIDYVIVGREYISQFQEAFGENLIFKVILPQKEIIYQRDEERECWTTGKEVIDHLYENYISLRELIGRENFIDNANETPEETAAFLLNKKKRGLY